MDKEKNLIYRYYNSSKITNLNKSMNRPDPDIEAKVRLSIRSINETIQQNAHEPSLALYRLQVNKIDQN